MRLKIAAGKAAIAALLLLTILAGPLAAQQDRYEETVGVSAKARELFTKAQRLEQAGHGEEAIKAYREAIRLEPNYTEAYTQMGLAYANLNEFAEAVKAFREVVRLQPQSGPALGNLGAAYMKMGRFCGGPRRLSGRGAPPPRRRRGPLQSGSGPGQTERDQEALAEFAQAVKLQPDMARAHRNLGMAYFNLNRLEEARKALQEAAALDPKNRRRPIMPCASTMPGPGTPRPPTGNSRSSRAWIKIWPKSWRNRSASNGFARLRLCSPKPSLTR